MGGITGASFCLNNGQFDALDTTLTNLSACPERFVQDMATYLSGNGLVKNIALSRLNTRYHLLEENAR